VSLQFRTEVLQARHERFFGRTLLQPPVSFAVWTAASAAFTVGVVAFLLFGEYTRRVRVPGITAPAAGLLRITPPQSGIVTERQVEEGDAVTAGQVLFVLSSERQSEAAGAGPSAQHAILAQLRERRSSLQQELSRRTALAQQQQAAAARRLADLGAEEAQIALELATQAAREASAAEHADRFGDLERQRFVSSMTARQKRDELLEQTARRQSLERSALALRRETTAVATELRQLPLRTEQQKGDVKRELAVLEQEILSAEAARRFVVVAPRDGIITAIVAEPGQAVALHPIATLLPADSPLEAHLFAPSRAVGFVEPGQSVRLRYAAYPFQKFGQYDGVVFQVSRSPLAASELPPQLGLPAHGEGLYRITVRLASPAVNAYGRQQPLSAGMHLEADVMQDRRRLFEWIFEPVLGLRGKL
jgi:membrane fusion protein